MNDMGGAAAPEFDKTAITLQVLPGNGTAVFAMQAEAALSPEGNGGGRVAGDHAGGISLNMGTGGFEGDNEDAAFERF